jgi:hypothetical protein
MRAACITAVSQAIGRTLTANEVRDIETRITRSMRNLARAAPDEWAAKSQQERLQEAAEAAGQELVAEAALKQQREALKILAAARATQHVLGQVEQGIDALDALDRMIAFHADARSNFLSIETQATAIRNDALRQMLETVEASNPKWFGLFENLEGVHKVVRELFGEPTGDADARAGAVAFQKVAEQLRQRFNRAGGDVGQLEDWGLPHHHSQLKVAKAGREQWVADVLPKVNRDAYFNEDGSRMSDLQLTQFLGAAWTTIATGGANKVEPGQFRGAGMRANRGSESRQIHFRDAQAYMDYQASYGERTLYEVLIGHVAGVAKDIAHVETFGPNPDQLYRFMRDTIARDMKLADPTKVGKIDERVTRTDSLYNQVSGKTLPIASEWLARSFDTLRNWLIASRLGSAVVTAFSDDATLHLTGKMNNLPEMRLLANELAALNPANRLEERMALRAGLAMNTMLASLNRFGQEGLGSGFSKRLASTVLRASGLNAMTEARRRAFGVTMMGSIGSVVRSTAKLADLDVHDHRLLLSKGITDTDWKVWRKAALEDWGNGNDTMLTPESIYRIPDDALAALGDPVQLREQAATRLLGAILEEADVAVIEPGARERAQMGGGLQRGTWKGELVRSFFLFKSFPVAMIERHWARGMSLPNRGGRAAYLATLMAATTVLGMASLQVNELLQGRDPRNMNLFAKGGTRNWFAAMLKGGSLGIYGDFLFSGQTQRGSSIFATISGPVLGLGEDLLNLSQGNLMELAQGKSTHAGAELVRFVKSNLPGASLWYAKAGLDHLIFHQLQEYFSPGYLATMRSRSAREFGQKYWWEPGTAVPQRGPDIEAAIGE